MKKVIGFRQVLNQLKYDLLGKDSYRGVTLTYSWLANQFGHFSLGYIPTVLIFSTIKPRLLYDQAISSALLVIIFWAAFESYNFWGQLLSKRQSVSSRVFIPSKQRLIFQPPWGNILFDTLTDLLFFAIGALLAATFLEYSCIALMILCALLLIAIYPCIYWFKTKMYQQSAMYPFQFRLSQFDGAIDSDGKKVLLNFLKEMKNNATGKHLLIFGGRNSGKTSLGVGLANELSIKHRTCLYTTGMKLYNMFSFKKDTPTSVLELWSWRTCSVLLIDDINPGDPVPFNIVSPAQFLKMLNALNENKATLSGKNVIWIMGSEMLDISPSWETMIQNIGVPSSDIFSINLV
jgi:hypothetical protein